MADSKLRMQIVTALDNAGIKATEQQMKSLEKQIGKMNSNSNVGKLEDALGRMPGKLGGIGKALSGVAGKASLIVGAFTTGYEIGTLFFEKVQKGLLGWKDPLDQLIEANKKLKKWQDEEVKAWQKRANGMMSYYQREQEMIDKSIARINAKSQSYMRLQKAASDLSNAGADADIQQLERERFQDVIQLQAQGLYDAADQANMIYDMYRQQIEAKKNIAQIDAEGRKSEQEHIANQQKITKLLEKADSLERERVKLEGWKDELDAGLKNDEIDKNQAQINSRLRLIKRQMADLDKEASALADANDTYEAESATRALRRATLVDASNLERDKLLWTYDKSLAEMGDQIGIEFTEEFLEEVTRSSENSYNELKDIRANTQDLAEMLEHLLQVKQGGE